MNEKRGKITDKQFFTSRLFAGRLEEMAAAQSKRHHYSRRVHVELVWQPNNPDTAKTDNSVIWINCGNPVVTKVKGRVNRYWIIIGLFAHELGHVLFTDFLASSSYNRAMEAYRWYPEPPVILKSADARNEKDMWEYIKDSADNRDAVIYISHFISNVLEDGFTDDRIFILCFPWKLPRLQKIQKLTCRSPQRLRSWKFCYNAANVILLRKFNWSV